DGQSIGIGYDSAGRASTLNIARGVFTYGYDPNTGNLNALNAPGGVNLSYGYDGALLTTKRWSGPISGTLNYSYDKDFRLATSTINAGYTTTWQYDADSLLSQAGLLTLNRSGQTGLLTASALDAVMETLDNNAFGEPIS